MFGYAIMVVTNVVILHFCDYFCLVNEVSTASSLSFPCAQAGIPIAKSFPICRSKS